MSFKGIGAVWKQYKLDEVYDFASGLSKSRKEFGFGEPFVTFKDVFYNYFLPDELNELANTTEKERERCSVKRGDVFLTRTSETSNELGKSSVALKDYPNATFNGFTKRLRPKYEKVIVPEFSGYYFRSRIFRNQIDSMVTMTTRASLNNDTMSRLTIIVPPSEEQKAIAKVLSDLDEKIEINNKINKNLEEMAQAIFKRWFVDFEFPDSEGKPYKSNGGKMVESELGMIPKGWNTNSLLDIANYLNGLAMQKFRPIDDKKALKVMKIKELRQGCVDENSDLCSDDIKKEYIINSGDVIFSWSGTLLVDLWGGEICGLNQHLFKVNSNKFDKWFYYYWTKYHMNKFINIAKDKATTMGHIKRTDLSESKVLVPNDKNLIDMGNILNPVVGKIIEGKIENKKLEEIRDTLLPKLMSGKVRVPLD